MNTLQLHHGDCREVMRAMPSNSVDSIVTDPPYGLSFMGKKWDYDVPSVEIWAECLRVLKPGGHLLAFAGTRTQHRMACRIEDAGFEIRDMIAWVYGCLDDATEVATEHGVMPYHKTKIGDRVLCYNPSNGEYSYQPILEIVEYEYSDTAYRLVGDFGEQVVSRNHRVIVECGGSEAFQLAETLEREARVPVLEDLPALQQAIHDAHAGAGRAQQDMRAGMCGGDNRSEELGSKAAGNPQGADGGLRGVREAGMETGCVAAQGGDANVQPQMQWGAARSGMGDTCAQGAVGMVGGIGSSPRGAHDWAEQSGVEGRSNVSQPEGSLRRSADQVRAMPCWSNEHGPRGRLCHGASSCGGTGGWETTDANGVRASHQSRCDGQSAGEPDAVRHERTAQGIRAWGGHRSAVVRVVPFHYTGKVWCLRVPTGAFVAVRNGVAFPTGNSGFPKSLDVSKAIDKARRRDYVQVALDMGLNLPGRNVDDWTKEGHAPGDKWWSEFKAALPPETWQAIERRVIGSAVSGQSAWFARGVGDVTAPATDAAQQWQGWGTALKPALEPITMARKPLIGTVAANVAAHGTGGLNIDGCRVPIDQDADASQLRTMQRSKREADDGWGMSSVSGDIPSVVRTDGRWPANLIHDGSSDVVAAFPDSNGSGTARVLKRCAKTENNGWGMNTTAADFAHLPDAGTGSAARFFYCAKASKKDRGDGNGHPTVKPTDLMAYLCRLVTPPGGVVLDPFMGSGSTGKAAVREGFAFIGIEREADYLRIATARIEAQMCTSRAESGPPPQNDLFSESLRA